MIDLKRSVQCELAKDLRTSKLSICSNTFSASLIHGLETKGKVTIMKRMINKEGVMRYAINFIRV